MALGYCKECHRLVSIRPGGFRWGSRERHWLPIPHEHYNEAGEPLGLCPGDKRSL